MCDHSNIKVFISHTSKDIEYVKPLVELLIQMGLSEENLFCSSVPGYGVPLGRNIYDYLAEEFRNNNLLVIFVLSENYYNSAACLNEMGAAWILKKEYYSVLLPDFEFKQIDGAIDPRKIAIKLGPASYELRHGLAQLRDVISDTFGLKKISESRWEACRDMFLETINSTSK